MSRISRRDRVFKLFGPAYALLCHGQCFQFSSPNLQWLARFDFKNLCPLFGWPSSYTPVVPKKLAACKRLCYVEYLDSTIIAHFFTDLVRAPGRSDHNRSSETSSSSSPENETRKEKHRDRSESAELRKKKKRKRETSEGVKKNKGRAEDNDERSKKRERKKKKKKRKEKRERREKTQKVSVAPSFDS